MNKDIRIVLVGDHELTQQGLRHILEQEEDMQIVGDYTNAAEAFSEIVGLRPDIVLMDIHLPGMNGIEATRHLKRNEPECDAVVIILAESLDYQTEALEAGATSYLLKDITHAELTQTIREVYWSKHPPQNSGDFTEEAVELVIPPSANAARLWNFMCQMEERLNDDENYASIMHTVGSWDRDTIITILVQPAALVNITERLANMAEVEKVEEKPPAGDTFFSYPKKSRVMLRSNISASQRIQVTLKEPSLARQ